MGRCRVISVHKSLTEMASKLDQLRGYSLFDVIIGTNTLLTEVTKSS